MHPPIQQSSAHNASPSQHNYGTRMRRNSVLKPSARLRQSPPSPHPAPRRIRPIPILATHHSNPPSPDPRFPVFPLPNIMLHPEDASNKVFHAIGRSFLSVENRAMTIKDLAEMTLKYGLMCQNVSAASQAITTYIRNHMARCETQQDHPLLLRHVLSGTPADDDLVPALHSRVGGATNPSKPNAKDTVAIEKNLNRVVQGGVEVGRLTNFRRGTMVWYLSKAAGVSCPFARAGIRLCEYGKDGKKVAGEAADELRSRLKNHSKQGDAQCGEKRKRLRRGCRRDSDDSRESTGFDGEHWSLMIDDGDGESSANSSDDERPPKVKITLRLKPSAPSQREVIDLSKDAITSSDDEENDEGDDVEAEMHLDQPEVPWCLPPYPRRSIAVPGYTPSYDDQSQRPPVQSCRSPSLPCSASPPPDSDHDDLDSDFDWDDSSSLQSPTVQVKVESVEEQHPFKQESTDIRDMLDAWEGVDCAPVNPSTVSSATVKLPTVDDLKFDMLELWEWEFENGWSGVTSDDNQDPPVVKIEPNEGESLVLLHSPIASPCSPCTPFKYSSSPSSELGGGSLQFPVLRSSTALPSSASSPSSSSSSYLVRDSTRDGALSWQDAELLGPDSVHPHEFDDGWASRARITDSHSQSQQHSPFPASVDLVQERRQMLPTEVKESPPRQTLPESPASPSDITTPNSVVVRTCRPCTPEVCATQIEGISVYQTELGSSLLLRRIDTDFVNLSTILFHLALPPPSPLPHACVTISHTCSFIDGIWAPLTVARLFADGLPEGVENIFLSDDLVMRFPTALQEFYTKSTSGRLLNQFGPPFSARLSSPGSGHTLMLPQADKMKPEQNIVWERPADAGHVEESLLVMPPSFDLALAALQPLTSDEDTATLSEMPLSPTEQEIFHTLCVHPDWEKEESGPTDEDGKVRSGTCLPKQKPLRRSRRVADAVAARTRVVPPRTKGPRHP